MATSSQPASRLGANGPAPSLYLDCLLSPADSTLPTARTPRSHTSPLPVSAKLLKTCL